MPMRKMMSFIMGGGLLSNFTWGVIMFGYSNAMSNSIVVAGERVKCVIQLGFFLEFATKQNPQKP